MNSDLVEIGWTEEQWNRIAAVVTEEAQKGRVAAQLLPITGPEAPSTVAIPNYTLGFPVNPLPARPPQWRLEVDSEPTLHISTIAVNVQVRPREAAEPGLTAALGMFRRAANYVARIEDALIFNGRPFPGVPGLLPGIPPVFEVTGNAPVDGLFVPFIGPARSIVQVGLMPGPGLGNRLVNGIIEAINRLDGRGQIGPYACALDPQFFAAICQPNPNLVLPRDRILPFLQGPLLRSNSINPFTGVVVALSGSPIEIVVATDIGVTYLQTSVEPRIIFRVAERVALRIKEPLAIELLQ
jgi:uncharacterized linocin/CFP29 family protein